MPDFYTFYLVVLLSGLSNCVIWGAIVYRYRDLHAARYWLAGSMAGVLGGLILSSQGNSGLFLQTVGGNTLVMLGFWLNYAGVRRFHGDTPYPLRSGILIVLCTVAMLATFHIWYGRNPVYTVAQSLPLLATLLYLLKRSRRELGAAITCAAMGIACVAHGVIAGGNILLLTEIMPALDLRGAAAVDLLVFRFAAVTWNFGFLITVMGHLRSEVERLANEDDLTGLANRRLFMKHLELSCIDRRVFTVMLFDLDHFKTINDTQGHAAGDAALKHVAAVVRSQLRTDDLFARLGGDEFCVLLADTGEDEAVAIANNALAALKSAPFRWRDVRLDVTASIGIASSKGTSRSRSDIIMDEADRALYETKRRGRNGATVYTPVRHIEPAHQVIDFRAAALNGRHLSR